MKLQPGHGLPALAGLRALAMALVLAGHLAVARLVGSALDARPIAWLGRSSYSFYLWHS